MASTSFGEHLKRERELRGVSLEEVVAATRIKPGFLEALENGRWNELPGGAFNRGFIRSISRFLGLDEDGMVAEYALETARCDHKAAREPAQGMPRDYRPAVMAVCVLLLAMIAVVWFGRHEYLLHKRRQAAAAEPARKGVPSGVPADPPGSALGNSGGVVHAAPAPQLARDPGAQPALELHIEASKKTDLEVVADGKTLFRGRLDSENGKFFEARQGFKVTADDADRVQLLLNGRNIPFSGPNGRRATISLSRQDLSPPNPVAR